MIFFNANIMQVETMSFSPSILDLCR